MAKKIRVLIAENNVYVRQGMMEILGRDDDILVVANVANGKDAVEQIEELEPDVAVCDISMPHFSGLKVTEIIDHTSLATQILVVSVYDNRGLARMARSLGAGGFLSKAHLEADLASAIRIVNSDKKFFYEKRSIM